MTTPGTMDSILEQLKDMIDDADQDILRHEAGTVTFSAGFDAGYADGLRDFWRSLTGDPYPPGPALRQPSDAS